MRLWYEYIYFYFFSHKKQIDVWLSMHDMTPNVKAKKRYVYCHNASPFYEMTAFEKKHAPKLRLFNLFYKYLYKINLKKNDGIIVQQFWLKEKFQELYGVNQVLVSYPDFSENLFESKYNKPEDNKGKNRFFYPSFPRVFKNFEIVCQASKILVDKGIKNFEVDLTIDGSENTYTNEIVSEFKGMPNLNFLGLLSRKEVFEHYHKSSHLIFPSKLESWGLPITEYKSFNKPMLLADSDYAKEALGDYDKVRFFDPYNAEELASTMENVIRNKIEWSTHQSAFLPDANSWETLFDILLRNEGN